MLEALDGVAYLVGREGAILGYNAERWNRFAIANGAPELADPGRVLGRSLFDYIAGEEVVESQRAAAELVWTAGRSSVAYIGRCDSPDLRRDVRVAITPVHIQGAITALLYQSQILREELRPPMGLLDYARSRIADETLPILSMCSYCHSVLFPPGAPTAEWITPESYYRRGGTEAVRLSHTICPACHRDVILPMLQGGQR